MPLPIRVPVSDLADERPSVIMVRMSAEATGWTFRLTVKEVFSLTGRGTAVLGSIEDGEVRVGDTVEIWEGADLVATAPIAAIDGAVRMPDRERRVGLVFLSRDLDRELLRPGQVIRRT